MAGTVTIAIPVYKRLEYLPHVLRVVAAQDHPDIELIVSDNGMNGGRVREIVSQHYPGPAVCRSNPRSVPMGRHFTQLAEEASGDYFVLLCDDDEISPDYLSEMTDSLEREPEAAVAVSRQEMIAPDGSVLRRSSADMPPVMTAEEFIDSTWRRYQFGLEGMVTVMARTARLRGCGGYPDFRRGTSIDNAALVRMILGGRVALNSRCVFRWRVDDASYGWSVSAADLAIAAREFIGFLSTDPVVLRHAAADPDDWRRCREILVRMTWETYLLRWRDIYSARLGAWEWLAAAFRMPFIPPYYKKVARILAARAPFAST
jgi:glycosyltransferase involved in cell wall biosynthesis